MKLLLFPAIVLLAAPLPSFAGEKAFSLDEHTVALWNFDEGSGGNIGDEGPLHIETTFPRPSGAPLPWEAGKFGSALRFSGHHRILSRPDSIPLPLENGVTVEAWIKIDSKTMGDRMGLFQNMVWRQSGFRLEIKEDRAVWMVEAAGKEMALASNSPIPLDEWVKIAASYDGGTMRLFVNDALDAEKKAPGGVTSPHTGKIIIGYSDGKGMAYFQGWIDALWISDIVREETAATR